MQAPRLKLTKRSTTALSAQELKAECQSFSQSRTPNVRLAAALTSEAKNRENKMTKLTKPKI